MQRPDVVGWWLRWRRVLARVLFLASAGAFGVALWFGLRAVFG